MLEVSLETFIKFDTFLFKNVIKKNKIKTEKIKIIISNLNKNLDEIKSRPLMSQPFIRPSKVVNQVILFSKPYLEVRNAFFEIDKFFIKNKIHPLISSTYYQTAGISDFLNDKEAILQLSSWLYKTEHGRISYSGEQTRAMDIFNNEKSLYSGGRGRVLLSHLRFDEERLYIKNDPSPLPISLQISPSNKNYRILIFENLEIWRLSRRSSSSYDFHVFGSGNGILGNISELEPQLNIPFSSMDVYYVGDIDRAGVSILYNLVFRQDVVPVKPCLPIYSAMLMHMVKSPKPEQLRNKDAESYFCSLFPSEYYDVLMDLFNQNYCIPQEVLKKEVLTECLKINQS